MIDNLNQILPLLEFKEEGDFYRLLVLQRKKDQKIEDQKDCPSSEVVQTYCVENAKYLLERYNQIKAICELGKARAYIHLQKQNHRDVSYEMNVELATRLKNGVFNQKNLFESTLGQTQVRSTRWIVDIDTKDGNTLNEIERCIQYHCLPDLGLSKTLSIIPTKAGYHLITNPFNVQEFKKIYPEIEVHKKNPTLLYYPKSLEN